MTQVAGLQRLINRQKMAINKLLASLFSEDLYIQIWENRLCVRCKTQPDIFDDVPLIALRQLPKGRVVEAIGSAVYKLQHQVDIEISNPFSHPRQLLADFHKAEKLLQCAIKTLFTDNFFGRPSPRVIVHPMEKLEGGLTLVEVRAFKELCEGAGARDVVVYTGGDFDKQNFDFDEIKKSFGSQSVL